MSNKLVKQQANTNVIKIDDGTKVYEIRNQRNELTGTFVFAPSDSNITARYDEVVEFFNNFEVPEDMEKGESVKYIQDKFVEKISYLINADANEAFFKTLGAFTPLASGYLYVEEVLYKIGKIIEREFGVNGKKVQRRMNKYVAKYHK